MSDDRAGGIALIAAGVALMVTMAFHPSGRELLEPGFEEAEWRALWVHGLALATLPVWFLGGLALSRRLSGSRHLSVSALTVWGFALVAGMIAGAASGLLGPAAAEAVRGASGDQEAAAWAGLRLVAWINRAFATLFVVASAAAIGLWSLAALRSRAIGRGLGVIGLSVSTLILLAFLSGHVGLDVHGFGLLAALEVVWFVPVGVTLARRPSGSR